MKRGRISISVFLCFLMMMFLVVSGCSSSDAPAPAATTYTVTFDSQSATAAASPTSKTVTSPATTVVTLPAPPTKTNYYFAGWWTTATSGGTEFTASTPVTASITVYARWTTDPVYTVTFDGDGGYGGTDVGPRHVTLPATTVGTLPADPTAIGYNFGGWWTAIDGGGTHFLGNTTVGGDITVHAYWVPYDYTVTFDSQSGTPTPTPTPIHVASPATTVGSLPTAPTKTSNTFAGWFTIAVSGGTQFTATTPVTGTITVYARWTTNPVYTVTYDSQGGTAVDAQHVTLPATTVGTLPTAPTRTSYTFNGWNKQANGLGDAFLGNTVVTGNITVYAKWTVIPSPWSQADLTGTWRMNMLVAGSSNEWMRVTVAVNSTGVMTFLSCLDSSGGTTCPGTGVGWTINSSGVISETDNGTADNSHYTMTSNKNFIAGTGTMGTDSYQLIVMQKVVSGTTYSAADVQSKSFVYHSLTVGTANRWEYGAGTIDASGALNITSWTDPSGSGTAGVVGALLSVDADGVVTMSGSGSGNGMATFQGFLSDDKKTIVGTSTELGPGVAKYQLMIIQVTGKTYTAGPLPAGISAGHMLAGGTTPAPFWLHHTSTVASGGVITLSDWVSSNSGITNPGTTNHGSITASGTVTIDEISSYHGQVSDDGKFTVATQTNAPGIFSLQVNTQ